MADATVPRLADYLDAGDYQGYRAALAARQPPAPPNDAYAPTGTGNFLTSGLGAGYHEALGELGSAGEAAGRAVGFTNFADAAKQWSDQQRQQAATYQRPDLETTTPWYDPREIGYQIAKGVPTMGAMLAAAPAIAPFVPEAAVGGVGAGLAAALGRTVAPSAIRAGIGGAVAAYPFSVGSNVQRAEAPTGENGGWGGGETSGVTQGSALEAAALGVPQAALFGVPAERFAGAWANGVGGTIASRVARGAVQQAPYMAAVSGAQEALTQLMGDPSRDFASRAKGVVDAALGGGLQGAVFGGAFGALRPANEINTKPAAAVATPELDQATQFLLPKPEWNAPQATEIPLLPPPAIPMGAPPLALPKPEWNAPGVEQIGVPPEVTITPQAEEGQIGPPPVITAGPPADLQSRPFMNVATDALVNTAHRLRESGNNPDALQGIGYELMFRENMAKLANAPAQLTATDPFAREAPSPSLDQVSPLLDQVAPHPPTEAAVTAQGAQPLEAPPAPAGYQADNPGGKWLAGKQDAAERNMVANETPMGTKGLQGATTATAGIEQPLFLPTRVLAGLNGVNDEKPGPGNQKYDDVVSSIKSDGYNNKNAVQVFVNHLGQAYLSEGNNRVRAAMDSGVPTVRAEIHWRNGAEQVNGDWSPAAVKQAEVSPALAESSQARPLAPETTADEGGVNAPSSALPEIPTDEEGMIEPPDGWQTEKAKRQNTWVKAQTLRGFVRAQGGLKDPNGDIAAMGLDSLIRKKNGKFPDRMREAAAEAGYLGGDTENATGNTTVADFLDALADHPRYRTQDMAEVQRAEQAAAYNEDMDALENKSRSIESYAAKNKIPLDRDLLAKAAELWHVGDARSADDALERAAIQSVKSDETPEVSLSLEDSLRRSGYGEGLQDEGGVPEASQELPDRQGVAGVPAEGRQADFQAHLEQFRQQRAKASGLVDAALSQDNPRLVLEKGDKKIALTKDTLGDYPYRITSFDKDGPIGHREYRATDRGGALSMDAEIDDALRQGYTLDAKSAAKIETAKTEAGPQGTRQTLIPGVEPVTDKQRAEVAAAKPLRGGNAPADEGLFGGPLPDQLFSKGTYNPPRTPLDRDLSQKLMDGASTKALLQHTADNHPNPEMGEMARLLLKNGDLDKTAISFAARPTEGMPLSNDRVTGDTASATFSRSQNRINIYDPADISTSLLHEATHAATQPALDGNTTGAQEVKRIFNAVKDRSPDSGAYGLTDVHEFIAEAMSNPKFRDFLKGENWSTGSKIGDMWTGVKNAVFKMLRMPERVRSAFDQVMEQMPGLMKESADVRAGGERSVGDELPRRADDGVKEGIGFVQGALDHFADKGSLTGVASRAFAKGRGAILQALHNETLVHIAHEMKATVGNYIDTGRHGYAIGHVQAKISSKGQESREFLRGNRTLNRAMQEYARFATIDIDGRKPLEQLADRAPKDVADKAAWIRTSPDAKELRDWHSQAAKAYNDITRTPEGLHALNTVDASNNFQMRAAMISSLAAKLRHEKEVLNAIGTGNKVGDFFDRLQNMVKLHDDPILANEEARASLLGTVNAIKQAADPFLSEVDGKTAKDIAKKTFWPSYEKAKETYKSIGELVSDIEAHEAKMAKVPNYAVGREGDYAAAGRIAAGPDGKLSSANFDKLRDRLAADGFGNSVITLDPRTGNPDIYIRTETKEQAARAAKVFRQAAADGIMNTDKKNGGKDIFSGPRKTGFDWNGVPLSALHKFGQLMYGAMPDRPDGIDNDAWNLMEKAHQDARDNFSRQFLDILPDHSLSKLLVNRKMVQGYSPDVLKFDGLRAGRMSRGIGNLAIATQRADAITAINKDLGNIMHNDSIPIARKEALNQVVQELALREKARQAARPSPTVDFVRSLTHVAEIGLSVPYFFLLQSQLGTLVLPELGKIYGHGTAFKSMMANTPVALEVMRQVLATPGARRTMQMRAENLKPNGPLTQAHIDALLREDNRGGFNSAGFTAANTEGEFPPWLERSIELGSMMSMYSEQLPRLVTFLSAHDLASKAPEKIPQRMSAEEYAHSANTQANMAFGQGDTPRLFGSAGPAGPAGKLMAQFMSFSAQLAQKIYREVDDSFGKPRAGEDQASAMLRRQQGRSWLLSHAAATTVLAGSLGLPGPTFAAEIYDKLKDWATGEDSSDVQADYRNWLSQVFGPQMGEVIARGAPRAVGLDMSRSGESDLPGRILPFMSLLTDKRKFEDAEDDFFRHMQGPAVGLLGRQVLGVRDMLNGDYLKGMTKVVPEIFKGPMEAMQMAKVGGYPTGPVGTSVADPRLHPGAAQYALAALGIDTAGQEEAHEAQETATGLRSMQQYREQNIVHHLAEAVMQHDQPALQQWMAQDAEYRQEHPGDIPPSMQLRGYLERQMRGLATSGSTGLPPSVSMRDLALRQKLEGTYNFQGR